MVNKHQFIKQELNIWLSDILEQDKKPASKDEIKSFKILLAQQYEEQKEDLN